MTQNRDFKEEVENLFVKTMISRDPYRFEQKFFFSLLYYYYFIRKSEGIKNIIVRLKCREYKKKFYFFYSLLFLIPTLLLLLFIQKHNYTK